MTTAIVAAAMLAGAILEDGVATKEFLRGATPRAGKLSDDVRALRNAAKGPVQSARTTGGVPGIDSLVNFTDQFVAPGFDDRGNPQTVWPYSMVGQAPQLNRKTVFDAPIVPVTVELLDAKGNVRVVNVGGKLVTLRQSVPDNLVDAVVKSPMFEDFTFNSGKGQFNDQMMRAEFWNRIRHDGNGEGGYHNILKPSVKRTQTMRVPLGSYTAILNDDGSCCFAVLININTFVQLLFPPTEGDPRFVIGASQRAGDVTTRDISTFFFNSVFLNGAFGCCVLGFHEYDVEPGDAKNGFREKRFVMNFASWIPTDAFLFGFEDITALSHELNELFNDPFVDNATPWWLSIDDFFGPSLCQNNLETGDVVEVLTGNPVFPIQMNDRTYHPQNEAMLPWFAFESPSSARNGAYSFPDETTLRHLSPGPLRPGCVP